MHGIFPLSATNDGPRGGALWNIASWIDGLGAWRLRSFDPGQQMPYALPGRSCEAWTRTAISIACVPIYSTRGVSTCESIKLWLGPSASRRRSHVDELMLEVEGDKVVVDVESFDDTLST